MNDFTLDEYKPFILKLARDRGLQMQPPAAQDWVDRLNRLGVDPQQFGEAVEGFITNPPPSRGWPQWSEFLPYLRKFVKGTKKSGTRIPTYDVEGSWDGDWESVSEERRIEIAGKVCRYWQGRRMAYPVKALIEFLSPGFLEKWEATRLEERRETA